MYCYCSYSWLVLPATGWGRNVRLHGSLKEFGANVVSMDFDGAAGELSKEWSQKITVNKDGSFDFSFDLKKPGYYSVGLEHAVFDLRGMNYGSVSIEERLNHKVGLREKVRA